MKKIILICTIIIIVVLGIVSYNVGYYYGSHLWDNFYEQYGGEAEQ